MCPELQSALRAWSRGVFRCLCVGGPRSVAGMEALKTKRLEPHIPWCASTASALLKLGRLNFQSLLRLVAPEAKDQNRLGHIKALDLSGGSNINRVYDVPSFARICSPRDNSHIQQSTTTALLRRSRRWLDHLAGTSFWDVDRRRRGKTKRKSRPDAQEPRESTPPKKRYSDGKREREKEREARETHTHR